MSSGLEQGSRDRTRLGWAIALTMLILAACGEVADPVASTDPSVETTTTSTSAATTTTTASTTTSTVITTTVAPAVVVIEADGLGVVQLGSDPDQAIEAITAVMGPPDDDSDWVSDVQNPLGFCGDEEWRLVQWGQLGVVLTDGVDEYAAEGGRHFAHYGSGGWLDDLGTTPLPPDDVQLRTAASMTVGDTRDRVLELYGDQAEIVEGNEIYGSGIWIDLGDPYPIMAWLDPDTSTVGMVQGGEPCGE